MGYGEQLIQQGIEIGERRGRELGEHNGRVAVAIELLSDRFGALPGWALEHLEGADNDELRRVMQQLHRAASLAALLDRSS
jgi:hypothetical protein